MTIYIIGNIKEVLSNTLAGRRTDCYMEDKIICKAIRIERTFMLLEVRSITGGGNL